MRRNWTILLIFCLLFSALLPLLGKVDGSVQAQANQSVTADDLLALVNGLRTSYGLSALTVNSTLMSTAQSTAQQMADQNLTWHIGSTSERVAAAGYSGSSTVYATENFAMGDDLSIEFIQSIWADDSHMIPMKNPIYCDLGAGVATSNDGTTYYVVHAAYSSTRYCGEYISPNGDTLPTVQARTTTVDDTDGLDDTADTSSTAVASDWMNAVVTVTPNVNGELVHEVLYGHTLWSIAVTYDTTMEEIKTLNGMWYDDVYVGQYLLIPTPAYFALTPSATLTPTSTEVAPVTMATQSTEMAKHTPTPTATRTLPPSEMIALQKTAAPDDAEKSADREGTNDKLIILVFLVAAFIIVLTFWQPWKSPTPPEPEDPLHSKVE